MEEKELEITKDNLLTCLLTPQLKNTKLTLLTSTSTVDSSIESAPRFCTVPEGKRADRMGQLPRPPQGRSQDLRTLRRVSRRLRRPQGVRAVGGCVADGQGGVGGAVQLQERRARPAKGRRGLAGE